MARASSLLGNEGPFADFVGANPIYDARAFLFGGGEIGPHTLLRFYILHCIFIPLVARILMEVPFYRVRQDGFFRPLLLVLNRVRNRGDRGQSIRASPL